MISTETLENWLTVPTESENLEFKEAPSRYSIKNVLKYCAAMFNVGGGHFVLGVTDAPPREVIGTNAFTSPQQMNELKLEISHQLRIHVHIQEIFYQNKRILVFEIPSRPAAQPLRYRGRYLMRAGSSVVAIPDNLLKEIFAEDTEDWLTQMAKENVSGAQVIELLDTQIYFALSNQPYPSTQSSVLEHLQQEGFIQFMAAQWAITNLGAILLAKDLRNISWQLARKAPRFVLYEGVSKIKTRTERQVTSGYATCFESLVSQVHDIAPHNQVIEEMIRVEQKMFPLPALRELIANALIHQDFSVTGTTVMIEMYDDRVEISNPGQPIIEVNRFIDRYQSRNERLTDIMRRLGICEEKGSGIDKVIMQVEDCQLPAPDFREDGIRTTAILFAHVDFDKMDKHARIRACYQHCCLCHCTNQRMTNATLRKRFNLGKEHGHVVTVSHIIASTKQAKLIKPANADATSLRYASYLPFWD